MPEQNQRILIIRLAGLGDVATASTILSRIRSERPQARVTWMTGLGSAPLVRMFAGVDEIIEVDERRLFRGSLPHRIGEVARAWFAVVRGRFDLVLLAHPDPRYRLIVGPMGARRLRRLQRTVGRRPNPLPGRFFGDEFARLLDEPGADPPQRPAFEIANLHESALALTLPESVLSAIGSPNLDVVIAPGGARNILRDDPLRRWPTERYAQVASTLVSMGYSVAMVGDVGDAWVRPAFSGVPLIDLIGQLDIPQTLRVMASARVALSHDTGPIHFARLVRTPLIALFGPTTPRQVLGDPPGVTVLWGGAQLACRPCYDGRGFAACPRNICIEDITVETVVAAVLRTIGVPAARAETSSSR